MSGVGLCSVGLGTTRPAVLVATPPASNRISCASSPPEHAFHQAGGGGGGLSVSLYGSKNAWQVIGTL